MWSDLSPKEELCCIGERKGLPLAQHPWALLVPILLLEVGGEVSKMLLPVCRELCD